MEEKVVKNLVERIGETIVWGPDQEVTLLRFDNWKGCYVRIEDGEDMVAEIDRQEGWTSKDGTFYAELIDLKCDSEVGYVQSKMASQIADAEWVAQKQMLLPMISELTVIGEERRADADEEEGHNGARTVVSIDWNDVEVEERTDLVIAPIADIKMAKLFGILVDESDKEKDDTSVPAGANRNSNPQDDADILKHMMEMGADDVDDVDDNELVNLYDKENPVIEVGTLWPNMDEFRMCFKTYAVNQEFEAKTLWTDRNKFYARCQGYDGGANPYKWRKRAEKMPPLIVEQCWPGKKARLNGCRKKRRFNPLTEPILDAPEQNEHVLDAAEQTEPIFDAPEQSEPVFDAHEPILQTEPVLELVVQTEPVLELVVQSEIVAEVEEVYQVKHAEVLGRAVGRPTDPGKKTRSINKLYAVEGENTKKSSGKKRQKK
ncbi:hypothetical protein D1007_21301 [Hordeum vulgare]|nr:hypothetical protein D1007_21301 [Hordeum vulgare]